MIIERILKKIKKSKNSGDLEEGLILGLIWGLSAGLIAGLIEGLIWGLIAGLIAGLIGGLIWGLGYFLVFFWFLGLASLISHFPNFIPLWLFILLGIILIEFFFWFDTQKPKKKQSKFWFTCLKKVEAILETIAVLGYLNLARLTIEKIARFKNWDVILKWTGYIGAGLIVLVVIVGIIWLYIKLNSMKYDGVKK